jgi:hypothetical protein
MQMGVMPRLGSMIHQLTAFNNEIKFDISGR